MLVERPDPVAAAGQVVVRNRWIGVNYVDLQHRAGHPYPVRLPLIPGTEAAGTVVAVGAGADPALAGAPVVHFGHLCGVYAEMTAVPAEFVVPLAAGVPLDAAAAVAMNGTTAYVLTSMACRIGPGDVVVVQADAGATGGAVVQLAAASGRRGDRAHLLGRQGPGGHRPGGPPWLAVQQVPDPVAAVLSVTGGRGADVVYDAGGRDTFEMSLDMLATRGTLVLYGQSSGPVAPFEPGRLSGSSGAGRGAGS